MREINKSYIYSGTIRHRRFAPFDHFFTYPLFMTYIDLNSIDSALSKSWLWNIDKPALVSFMRKDYHGDSEMGLDESVRKTVFEKIGYKVKRPYSVTNPFKIFRLLFNPVSFYYCFDEKDSEVEIILAEVTNTPWDERHAYIIREKDKKENLEI